MSLKNYILKMDNFLQTLDLSDNLIEDLEENSFVDIINLENLDLSHNRLTDLRRGAVHRYWNYIL